MKTLAADGAVGSVRERGCCCIRLRKSIQKSLKQFLRSYITKFNPGQPVQFIANGEDVLIRELLNGHSLGGEGMQHSVVALIFTLAPKTYMGERKRS